MDKSFKEDVLARQLDEGIRIQGEEGNLLHDKYEWVRSAGVNMSNHRM